MEPTNTDTSYTEEIPQSNSKKFIILGLVVFIILVVMTILFLSARKSSPSPSQSGNPSSSTTSGKPSFLGKLFGGKSGDKNQEQISKKTYSEISTSVLAWVLKQQDNNGKYYFGENCTTKTSCERQSDNRVGIQATWGVYKAYEKSKEPRLKESISKSLNAYTDESVVPIIQNNFWNCKLMYELQLSNSFNDQEKEKIRNICFFSQHVPLEESEYTPPSVEELIRTTKTTMERTMNKSISTFGESISQSLRNEYFINQATASSDYVYKYLMAKEEIDYQYAYVYFNKALKTYNSKNSEIKLLSPLLGIASLDLYDINKNETYLDFAKFINNENIKSECDSIDQCVNNIYLLKELSKRTKDQSYNDNATKLLSYMTDKYFDSKGYAEKFNKESYYFQGTNAIYPVMYNGLIIPLLYDSKAN